MVANTDRPRKNVLLTKLSGTLAGGMLLVLFGISAPWFAYGVPPVDDNIVEMDMRFAGTFFNSDELNIGHFRAKGSPGSATIRFVTVPAGGLPPDFPSDCCTGTVSFSCLLAHNTANPLIFTFDDLSLLFANIKEGTAGDICVDLSTGGVQARIEVEFTGGKGRFEGATGEAVVLAEIEVVSPDGTLSGETGTIVGEIVLP